MENRTHLKDASLAEVMQNIETTKNADVIVDSNSIYLDKTEQGNQILAAVDGVSYPVNATALSQIDTGLMKGFAAYGENLRENGIFDLYLTNANRLISQTKEKRMVRLTERENKPLTMRAWLSPAYQRYDDDAVFGAVIDAISDTASADQFTCLGGYRTDETSYIKLITKQPIFSISADGRERAFHAGFIVSNSEVGLGTCRLDVLLIDRFCTNGCIFSSENLGTVRMVHRGKNYNKLPSGTRIGIEYGGENVYHMEHAVRSAVKTAFNKDLYLGYKEVMQNAADLKLDATGKEELEIYVKHLSTVCKLSSTEQKAIVQRMLETGDRSLFGVQAAITDEAKYAETYDRKLELERVSSKIFTEVPRRWKTIQSMAASDLAGLDN